MTLIPTGNKMKEQKLIVLQGLPASGKTTWAMEYVEESPSTRIRVCRDDLRRMCGIYWVPQRENFITCLEDSCIKNGLLFGMDVVVDATNLKGIVRFERLIRDKFYTEAVDSTVTIIEQKFLNISVEECIKRDKNRDSSVGEEVIIRMAEKYLKHTVKEAI